MKLLVEYNEVTDSDIIKYLKEIDNSLISCNNKLKCVGYFYSNKSNKRILILPKVYKKFYGNIEDIKNKEFSELLSKICIALRHFRKRNPEGKSNSKNFDIESKVFSPNNNNDEVLLPDIEQALIDFHKQNKYLFTQIALSKINKTNKIKWTKTVTNKQALIQNKKVIYPELYTQKKEIDYDEKLIILFYSVLNYLKRTNIYEIEKQVLNYKLLSVEKIKQFRETNKGMYYLKSIRSQYFSDKLVKLWKLLYAYFSKVCNLKNSNNKHKDYLLVNNFEMVFEDMVEQLIGCNNGELETLKNRKIINTDKKDKYKLELSNENEIKEQLRIIEIFKSPDHIYEKENIFCIADSKYRPLDNFYYSYYDIKKQFDYAKIIKEKTQIDITNIYNFFICPDYMTDEKDLIKADGIKIIEKTFIQYKYEGDSEPFNLMVFEINFLSLLKSYIKNNAEYNILVREKIIDKYKERKELLKNQKNYKAEYIIGIGNAIFDILNYLEKTPYSYNKYDKKDILLNLDFKYQKSKIDAENFMEIETNEHIEEVFSIFSKGINVMYGLNGEINKKYNK